MISKEQQRARLVRFLKELQDSGFYGVVEWIFHSGNIVQAHKKESIKLELLEEPDEVAEQVPQ